MRLGAVPTVANQAPVTDLSVRPHSATCLIQTRYSGLDGVLGIGTGFLIGQGRVATAAHVLWNDADGHFHNKRLPDIVEVYLGQGIYEGYGSLTWKLHPTSRDNPAHPGFIKGDRTCDVARLQLPENPTAPLSVMGFPANLNLGETVTVGGFPSQLKPFGHYECSGSLANLHTPVFGHQAPTIHGQSGAPVRVKRDGGWTVVGVHVGKADLEQGGSASSRAVALTPTIVNWLLR